MTVIAMLPAVSLHLLLEHATLPACNQPLHSKHNYGLMLYTNSYINTVCE